MFVTKTRKKCDTSVIPYQLPDGGLEPTCSIVIVACRGAPKPDLLRAFTS